MKLIKKIIFWKLSLWFFIITSLRNKFYDFGLLKSYSFSTPIISIGNLSAGGTGKTPMVEFFIDNLEHKYKIGVLSRGYKRKSRGFILASAVDDAKSIGDEPFQYYSKFKSIIVAVDKKRKRGIKNLINLGVDLIILDDAFQHRRISPSYSIILSDYSNLFINDSLMPLGTLRECKSGYQRANSIIITKCPENFSKNEMKNLTNKINLKSNQHIFFSKIIYSDHLISKKNSIKVSEFRNKKVKVVTGIVNSKVLIKYFEDKGLLVSHAEFPDHYDYRDIDLIKFKDEIIITTEKDYVKLKNFNLENLYYIPIKIKLFGKDNLMEIVNSKIT